MEGALLGEESAGKLATVWVNSGSRRVMDLSFP